MNVFCASDISIFEIDHKQIHNFIWQNTWIQEEDTCQRLVAQAIANERIYTNPIRHLNLKYNCTG